MENATLTEEDLSMIGLKVVEMLNELHAARGGNGSKPKSKSSIGAPLREAPEIGADMWVLSHNLEVYQVKWHGGPADMAWLASGSVFATPEDAEFTAKKRKIFACPIGEWSATKTPFSAWINMSVGLSERSSWDECGLYLSWLDGHVTFDYYGTEELERRCAAWKALCKEYGIA